MRCAIVAFLVVSCGAASADVLPKDTCEIKTLTAQQADAFAKHENGLGLDGTLDAEEIKAIYP